MKRIWFSIAVLGAILAAVPAQAVPGVGDPTFGTSGLTVLDQGDEVRNRSVIAVASQSDGRTVALLDGGVVARLTTDGVVDSTFGGGRGFVRLAAGGMRLDSPVHEVRHQIVVGPGDSITVVGPAYSTATQLDTLYEPALARLTANGELDPTFDGDGLAMVVAPTSFGIRDMVVTSTGAVGLLVEWEAARRVVRLTATGVPDPGFGGGDGVFEGPSAPFGSSSLAAGPGDTLYLASGSPSQTTTLRRLTATGAVDPAFGTGGVVDIPDRCALLTTAAAHLTLDCGFSIRRFTHLGAPDTGFDGDGLAASSPEYTTLGVDGAGRIVFTTNGTVRRRTVTGASDSDYGVGGAATVEGLATAEGLSGTVATLRADGSLVVSVGAFLGRLAALTPTGERKLPFGTDGVATFPLSTDIADWVQDVFAGPAGGTYVVHGYEGQAVSRLDSAGAKVSGFGSGGTLRLPNARTVLVDSVGRLLVVSLTPEFRTVARRYTASGALDPTYGVGGTADIGGAIYDGSVPAAVSGDRLLLPVRGPGEPGYTLARLDGTGAGDAAFGAGGTVAVPLLDAGQTLTALGVDESGRPLLGFAGTSGGGSAVVRLTAAGAVDTSFGEDGMSSFPPRPGETGLLPVRRLVPGPGGSVLFSVETRGFSRALRITRLTEAGALDAEAVLLSGVSETKEKLVVEPDGRVVVIKPGVSHYDVLVRLDPRLRPDSTFVPGDDALEALANVDGASGALVDGRLVLASGWRTYPADQAGPVVDAIVRRLDSGPPTSRFVPVTPTRIMDTRTGLGGEKANGGEFRRLQVAGHGGVPATGASAVVLTMTAVDADPGYVTVWSSVGPQPTASNLNMTRAGQVVAAQVVVPIEPDGLISIFTSSSTHLLVDVAGWYEEADAAAAGRLVPVAPSRVLDTRIGIGAPPGRRGADTRVDLDLTGRGGVPATGASAVVLTLTGVGSSPGFLTVWPKGAAQPLASNLNVDHENQTMANHVMVPLGLDGDVSIYTSGGGHVLADVVGWITDPSAPSATSGLFVPLSPVRRLDSRGPIGGSPGRRPAGSVTQLALGGTPGLPTSGVGAVVANVTAVEADPTYLTVWAGGSRQPLASNVNVSIAGDIVPNLVTTPAGPGASLQVFTEGATHLVADVAGWYLA